MRTSRTVSIRRPSEIVNTANATKKGQNKLVVPVYSGFFSALTDNVMCTNAMYDSLKREIDASISPYSTDETIVLNIYESSDAGSDVRESVLVGFNRYITQYRKREVSALRSHFAIFLSLFFIGVLMEFLLYKVFAGAIAEWIVNTLDIFAWVFIWQFAAYMTFEFARDVKTVRRLSQILRIEYVFRHWE